MSAAPAEITRPMLGLIVDEVFEGAIEDASVIEDIYRVIVRELAPPVTAAEPEVPTLPVVAWATSHDEPTLFVDRDEAAALCDPEVGDFPIALTPHAEAQHALDCAETEVALLKAERRTQDEIMAILRAELRGRKVHDEETSVEISRLTAEVRQYTWTIRELVAERNLLKTQRKLQDDGLAGMRITLAEARAERDEAQVSAVAYMANAKLIAIAEGIKVHTEITEVGAERDAALADALRLREALDEIKFAYLDPDTKSIGVVMQIARDALAATVETRA